MKARVRLDWLAWPAVPALALVAFAPVLGLWFVADDFGHLLYNEHLPFPQPLLAFGKEDLFYRPLSTALTWNLGTTIFGTNALPYHAFSLAVHALSALLLARLGRLVSGSRPAGLIAGALFAIYPLPTEPVAWLAAQWDVLAGAFSLGAALGFGEAWRRLLSGRGYLPPYLAGLLCAFLAVGMKESALPLALALPFVALAVSKATAATADAPGSPRWPRWAGWPVRAGRLPASLVSALALSLPYALPTLLFVLLRLSSGGRIGGYTNAATDFPRFFWDALVVALLAMLMPLNRTIFPPALTQLVGALNTLLLFGGLALWGRRRWPALLFALAWWLCFIVPAANLVPLNDNPSNLQNRLYYLSLMGFCLAIGALLSVPLEALATRSARLSFAAQGALGLTLLALIPATWAQLRPWTEASRQTRHIVEELDALLPPSAPGMWEVNAHDLPIERDGAYIFWNGLDSAIQVFHRQKTSLNPVEGLSAEGLVAPLERFAGRFNLDFQYDGESALHRVGGLAGYTRDTGPPTLPQGKVWDFRGCEEGGPPPPDLQVLFATPRCAPGYMTLEAENDDPILVLGSYGLEGGARWLRLGVSARYPAGAGRKLGEWFWAPGPGPFSQERSAHFIIGSEGEWRVYWTYVDVSAQAMQSASLRFDPMNARHSVDVAWISAQAIGK